MSNGKIFAQINIGPKNGGVQANVIQEWARIMVFIGHRFLEIWDNRKASVQAIINVYDVEKSLSEAKRKRSTEDPQIIRQKRTEARKNFWSAFSDVAEVEIEEIPIRGGEGTAQRILFYDTDKTTKKVMSMCRTREERWMKDPHFSEIRPIPDEKRKQNLHIIFSSQESPVDIAEKNTSGEVVRSWRFAGLETEIFDYKLVEKVEEIGEEEEDTFENAPQRPQPPTIDEMVDNVVANIEVINPKKEKKTGCKKKIITPEEEDAEIVGNKKPRRRRKASS